MIGGTLAVRVADSADDEGDAGLAESAEGVVEVDGMPAAMLAASRGSRFSPLPQGTGAGSPRCRREGARHRGC
jgi:hypothetical protein